MNTDDTAITLPRQSTLAPGRRLFLDGDLRQTRAASLYIHVPFCSHKCHYCDFYSIVDTRDRQGAFTDRLVRELAALSAFADPLRTVFIGGGTPSLLAPQHWDRLLGTLGDRYRFAPGHEFTVECNPETVTAELMRTLHAGGVNRVSMGAQSFDPRHLRTLERRHDPGGVGAALDAAAAAGIERRSIDLIYAVPGQTLAEFDADLDRALAMPIDHLSAYNLIYEPGTAMTARLHRGEFDPAEEDLEIAMFERLQERTEDAGLGRYEISNHARAGAACAHNLAYWAHDDWLAAGPSGSGHLSGHRYKNTPRLDSYLADEDPDGFAPICEHEAPDPRRALAERLMTGLRLIGGVDAGRVRAEADRLGPETRDRLEHAIEEQLGLGRVEIRTEPGDPFGTERLVVLEGSVLLTDGVARALMTAI